MTIDITHPAQDENLRKPYGHFEAVYDLDRDEFMEYLDDKIPDRMIPNSFALRVVGRDLNSADDSRSWEPVALNAEMGQTLSRDLIINAFHQIRLNQENEPLDGEYKLLLYKEGRDRSIIKCPIIVEQQNITIGWGASQIIY